MAESISCCGWTGLLTPRAINIDDWKLKAEVFSTQNEAERVNVSMGRQLQNKRVKKNTGTGLEEFTFCSLGIDSRVSQHLNVQMCSWGMKKRAGNKLTSEVLKLEGSINTKKKKKIGEER